MMKGDFETAKRQYRTARRALANAKGDGVGPLQKTYDQAKVRYLEHPEHPLNRTDGKKVEPEKRF